MIIEALQYGFMQKALITGLVISIACSLLGIFLVLQRYALIGDGLAHISFGGIAVGMLVNIMPFLTAMGFAILAAFGILKLREKAKIHGDTSIGIISHASMGLGVFIASIAHGFNVNLLSYLFGNILAISTPEVILSVVLALIVIVVIILNYRNLFYLTFDEESARAAGIKADFLSTLLIVLTAITVVASMRVIGLLLVSALIIMPAAAALQIANNFRNALVMSAIFGVVSVIAGLSIAYIFDFAVSGTIVLMNFMIFLLMFSIRSIRKQMVLKKVRSQV
ncbi:MAG: metal ABC transporter permease [Nanoarchaeota archaeon]|nr:metal ABC transporter permease [Nanoarchaeota archaeon]